MAISGGPGRLRPDRFPVTAGELWNQEALSDTPGSLRLFSSSPEWKPGSSRVKKYCIVGVMTSESTIEIKMPAVGRAAPIKVMP